jgi:hypothetical protein
MNGLYEPEKEKMRVAEIRSKRKAERLEKAIARKEKRQKYRKLYKEELTKHRATLQAQKEKDIDEYKTRIAKEKAERHARGRVKPFRPRNGYKAPSKAQLTKAGIEGGKLAVKYGQKGLSLLDSMYGGGRGGLKVTKKRSPKRKTTKRKTTKRKTTKRTPTKRKTSRKAPKRKGKSYYCYKCRKRHSYTSKIGRKHKR